MKNRVQKFPPVLFIEEKGKPMKKGDVRFIFWKDGKKVFNDEAFKTAKELCEYTENCDLNGTAAYGAVWIDADNQPEVICYSGHGEIAWLRMSNSDKAREYRASINRAKRLALGFDIIGSEKANNELVWTVGVVFNDDTVYTYECGREHSTDGETPDSFVWVEARNEIKIARVVVCQQMSNKALDELAKNIGYARIKPVHSDDVSEEDVEDYLYDNYPR